MRVVFRVDSSSLIGTGHLVRCLTLATALRERGAEVEFISREHPGNLLARLAAEGFATTALPAPAATADPSSESEAEDYAAWLGVPAAEDAAQTIEALDAATPDWLVVDHYGLDSEWETRLRPHVGRILAIDDLANRAHDCDVLLDQNYFAEPESRYRGLVPPGCRLLVGPRYALLRPEYREYRAKPNGSDDEVRRVLVFLGGTDRHGVTAMALEALSAPELAHLHVDVVVGANNVDMTRIEELASRRDHTHLVGPRPHLADLMWMADLAVGAGGATTWERMCLGLPSVTVSVAENQRPGCEALARAGLTSYAGNVAHLRLTRLREALRDLIRNGGCRSTLGAQSRQLVDGLGTLRVSEILVPTPTDALSVRPARAEDMEGYFSWANDPDVRRQAKNPEPISWEVHREWFAGKLQDSQSRLFVLMAGSLPVGQIRFDYVENEAWLSYSLDRLVRGRGWGKRLVALGCGLIPGDEAVRIRADVKVDNQASRAVFVRLGFKPAAPAQTERGYISYYRDLRGEYEP